MKNGENKEEEKKPNEKPAKPLLYFKEQGLTIHPWCIITIDKEDEYVGTTTLRLQHKIVFNRGMVQSKEIPMAETTLYFETQQSRDDKYELILMVLQDMNYKVIEM